MTAVVDDSPQDEKPMSNPFTRFLTGDLVDESLIEFIGYWDRVEALVISIYKNDAAAARDEREFEKVWKWLNRHYSGWESILRPYWNQSKGGERNGREDPFARLLAIGSAAEIVGNWALMQALPEAREALNLFVLNRKSK